jgi:hypothetical protein
MMEDFERLWRQFPRKVAKGAARKAFLKIKPDAAMVDRMLQAIAWQRQQAQWIENNGQFIPHLSTWLNQERWDDEPMEVPALSPSSARLLRLVHE